MGLIAKSFLKLHGCQPVPKQDSGNLGKLPSRFGGLSRVSDRLQKSGEKGAARPLSCRSVGELGAIAKSEPSVDVLRALAIQYRALYLYAQQSHHVTSGPTFLQDHEFYGGLYEAYEAAYDALAERLVGLGARQLLDGVQAEAAAKMQEIGSIASFAALLAAERSICTQIDAAAKMPAMSEGVRDLLVGLANESQARQYKLGQFLSAGAAS